MKRLLAVIPLALSACASADRCGTLKASGDGTPAEYLQQKCYAEGAMARGDLVKAEKHLRTALKLRLFEAPNYSLKLPLGKVLCAQGRAKEGKEQLEEFICMANADLGNISCPDNPKDIPPTACMELACIGAGSILSDSSRLTTIKELNAAKKELESCHGV